MDAGSIQLGSISIGSPRLTLPQTPAGRQAGPNVRLAEGGPGTLRARIERAFDLGAGGLHRFVSIRVGGDAHLTDDLMQQVWLAALRNAGEVPEADLERWMRGVARNLVITHWRRSGARPGGIARPNAVLAGEIADELSSPSPALELLSRAEARDQLLLALTELESDHQDLLIEHYFGGVPQAAIAQRLETSERAVEGRLYRARQALRGILKSPPDFFSSDLP